MSISARTPFDRIMYRGKTLSAMSEDELRSALRDCCVERSSRPKFPKPEPVPAGTKAAVDDVMAIFGDIFRGAK